MPQIVSLSGLYFPHTKVRAPLILKTALLLWDEIQFIIPHEEFKWRPENENKLVSEAYDLIGNPHVPTDAEKRQVHEQVEEILTVPGSHQWLTQPDDSLVEYRYEIYPQKLLHETWDLLEQSGLVKQNGSPGYFPSYGQFEDIVTSYKLGLLLMLYLAQACAGTTRRLITDRVSAYSALNEALAVTTNPGQNAPQSHLRIVTRSLKIIDADKIGLDKLIALRRSENGSDGHRLRKMRHKYLAMIDQFALELTNAADADVDEIQRQHEQSMKDDLAELRDELKFARTDALHEKEIFVAMVAAAGMSVAPIAVPAGIVSIITLNRTRLKYKRHARRSWPSTQCRGYFMRLTKVRLLPIERGGSNEIPVCPIRLCITLRGWLLSSQGCSCGSRASSRHPCIPDI